MENHNIHNILFCFHLCILIGALLPIPFGNILLPWFYWLYKGGRKNREISEQACRALNSNSCADVSFSFMPSLPGRASSI